MLTKLPAQNKIAAFDIDAQNTFTPVCPDELPVAEGDQIVEELNAQAALASLRIGRVTPIPLRQSGSQVTDILCSVPSAATPMSMYTGRLMPLLGPKVLNLLLVLILRTTTFRSTKVLKSTNIPMGPVTMI